MSVKKYDNPTEGGTGHVPLFYVWKMSGLTTDKLSRVPGAYSEICPGGAYIFYLSNGGPLHPLESENPLKSIDFTRPGGGLVPIASPEYAPAFFVKLINKPLNDFD